MSIDPATRTSASFSPFSALAPLGWDDARAREFAPFRARGLTPARVAAEHRSEYVVAHASDGVLVERPAVLAGRLRHEHPSPGQWPAVGDWVAIAGDASGDASGDLAGGGADDVVRSSSRAVVHAVLSRRSAFVRGAAGGGAGGATAVQVVAANVDVACIVVSAAAPVNPRALERYVALAWESGAVPVAVLTKADACADPDAALATAHASAPGVDVVLLSAQTGDGVDRLTSHLRPGRTAVLLGSSGAGKSTLVNRLLGRAHMATRAVREDGKGHHTTTHRELVRLGDGALLIDTPGMRELALWDADAGVEAAFADVDALADGCRFRDCTHGREPDCAVRAAVRDGRLDGDRLDAWHKLRRELAHLAARTDVLAAAQAKAANRVIHREQQRMLRERGR